jgi:alkylated DNA repair dioxygenase AlkB
MSLETLPVADARLAFDPAWLAPAEADALLDALRGAIVWERHPLTVFGRRVEAPRLSSWIGDPAAMYRYSGTRFEPQPWPEPLRPLRARLEHALGVRFNSVLANRYRDGRDCMGWHSDDEAELGAEPVIASLSLGAPRRFLLRHRRETARRFELSLSHGSLLVMAGTTQRCWRHALPRTARPVGERINLTFRHVQAVA